MASTPEGGAGIVSLLGYWLVGSDGGVFSYGAPFFGSLGGRPTNAPIVGMATTPDGGGYYLVASDGGVFGFGDAHFQGSMGGKLNKPVVGMAVDPVSGGYWLAAQDGEVFGFGTPPLGQSVNLYPAAPVVAMAVTATIAQGLGYYLAASDGGIIFCSARPSPSCGSNALPGGGHLNQPVVAISTTG